ncbi:GGDEF domain-containing protein [Radiobacillus sp. PE A8.2]|uniref:GGDEF domain-containing protein n=1 Tax=Radiobacillus sp. PE A8.2 TaxID=3380349 RepID=UPI00388FB4DE
MPHCSIDAAYNLANLIRKKIAKSSIIINSQEITVTARSGVTGALIKPDDPNQTNHSLMRLVDHALYSAKNSERNCVHSFQDFFIIEVLYASAFLYPHQTFAGLFQNCIFHTEYAFLHQNSAIAPIQTSCLLTCFTQCAFL